MLLPVTAACQAPEPKTC